MWLLHAGHDHERQQIVDAMEGNVCRCSAYKRILAAIEEVAGEKGGRS